MALQKTISLPNNFGTQTEFVGAYIKVRSVNFSKAAAQANVNFSIAKDGQHLATKQYDFLVDLAGNNAIAQAYEHLKTVPEFAGAIDC